MEKAASHVLPPMSLTAKAGELKAALCDFKCPDTPGALLELCCHGATVEALVSASRLVMSAEANGQELGNDLKVCIASTEQSLQAYGDAAVAEMAKCLSLEEISSKSAVLMVDNENIFKNLWKLFKAFKARAGQVQNFFGLSLRWLPEATPSDFDSTISA